MDSDMMWLVLLVLVVIVGPWVLSIVSLVMARQARHALRDLEKRVASGGPTRVSAPASAPSERAPEEDDVPQSAPVAVGSRPPAPPPLPTAVHAPAVAALNGRAASPGDRPASGPGAPLRTGRKLEVAIGAVAASFIGIATLLVGITYFVVYAIQNNWVGPGTRILTGIGTGVVLIGVGYGCETRGRNIGVLARALTGGGVALFYFCVFAAYGIYHLIGDGLCGVGLVVVASVAVFLAVFYGSQAIALMGVIGAFLTPFLIEAHPLRMNFTLVYIAVINIPVMLLGLRRSWQALYNTAFVLTLVIAAAWLTDNLTRYPHDNWVPALCFVSVVFGEFAVLGLLKLRLERQHMGRALDIVRLAVASGALMGALVWILTQSGQHGWIAEAFLLAAFAHVILAWLGWRWLSDYREEILTFLTAAIVFATLAVPAELDGIWVSLTWALEGVLLAWWGLRIRSHLFQGIAAVLSGIGLLKVLLVDYVAFADPAATLFLNRTFAIALIATCCLAAQSWLHSRMPAEDTKAHPLAEMLGVATILAMLAIFWRDLIVFTDGNEDWPWLISTAALLLCGVVGMWLARPAGLSAAWMVGCWLVYAVPLKMLWIDQFAMHDAYRHAPLFFNSILLSEVLLLAGAVVWVRACARSPRAATSPDPQAWMRVANGLLVILTFILLVTHEFVRADEPWSGAAITLWWGGSAFAVGLYGLVRNAVAIRYFALSVFAVTVLKVFFVDLADLSGLRRIAACMGVGLLLLVLSYAYQKVAPRLQREQE